MPEQVQPDESVLFPEEEVNGILIKPWSFGALFDISPSLEVVLDKMESKDLIKKFEESGGFLSWTLITRMFTIASPELLKIMSLTTGKSVEEIKSLDMDTGMKIAVVIFNQNKERINNALKNVFGPPK